MKKTVDDGRSLFDEVSVDCGVADGEVTYQLPVEQSEASSSLAGHPRVNEWREVPQPLFLSWSPARQFAYCAERDLRASIEYATSSEEKQWFCDRAAGYTRMKEELRHGSTLMGSHSQ